MATQKQIDFATSLLNQADFSTPWMTAAYSALGATMRQRSGSVESWLRGMSSSEISALIERLQRRIAKAEAEAELAAQTEEE